MNHRLITISAATALATWGLSGCGGGEEATSVAADSSSSRSATTLSASVGPLAADTVRPKARLTSPAKFADGLTGMLAVNATASDDVGVDRVVFQIDGRQIGAIDTTAPYGVTLNADLYPPGQHVIRAQSVDAAGNVSAWATSIVRFGGTRTAPAGFTNNDAWQGKGLKRIIKMMDVAEQQGDLAARDELLALAKGRIEEWFSGESGKNYFHYDKAVGTVVGYPDEFFFVEQLNDHHFTYGYWIRVMADIALRDPAWASQQKWGGMVDLLIADIATAQRGRADFPFLRNFDAYEGHSWASGVGLGASGNNQESSSEAINAWAGLILWGEITGNQELRDLGVYLYATEIEAINHYWFDLYGHVLPPEYRNVEVSMLFGGKYAHNTWWTDEPRQIKGINLLPLTTASTYLARDPKFVKRNLEALKGEMAIYADRMKRANPPDIWQDIFAKYVALVDPAQGLAQWNRWGAFELGDTRTHALHWLLSLEAMGPPDLGVTADTPLYSVFRRADGRRTYLAYNAGKSPITVRFSDGKTLDVAPGTLGRAN